MRSRTSTWVTGAGLVALVLAAAAWLLLYQPRLDSIAAMDEERATAEEQNARLRTEIAVLAADFERLPELHAELDGLRTQFPAAIDLPDFTRGLSDLAESTGAQVRSVTVGSSQLVGAAPDLPAAPDGTEPPALPAPPAGLHAVPVTLSVAGTFEQAQQFASALQGADQRLFLLSRLSWTHADQDGRETFSINGHTYVLGTGSAGEVA